MCLSRLQLRDLSLFCSRVSHAGMHVCTRQQEVQMDDVLHVVVSLMTAQHLLNVKWAQAFAEFNLIC